MTTPGTSAGSGEAVPPGAAPQPVVVSAAHASLEFAGRHVLVGHFLGSPLGGAESFVDERLGRRLTTRQLLRQYPERVGDAIVVDAPGLAGGRPGYPPGAIVVGLDLPGELTRDRLTAAVSAGLLCYAVREMESRLARGEADRPIQALEVSAVPVGTWGVGAISVESCVAAMVDGLILANQALHTQRDGVTGIRAWDHVRIAGLEFLEVLSDRAERVAHAVRRSRDLAQVGTAGHTELVLHERLRIREGGLPASLSGLQRSGDWQRVIIRNPRRERHDGPPEEGPGSVAVLEFTAIGRRARAAALEVAIDLRAIERLVQGAVRDARPDGQVGNTLYELLLPNDLKSDLAKSDNLQLIVDENTADLPWEALTARFGGRRASELALRGGFLRQFRDMERSRLPARPPVGSRVLVVGNPPPPPGASGLPGAGREGAAVSAALGRKFDVSALVWDEHGDPVLDSFPQLTGTTGRRVLDALFSAEWRVVHIAAHGVFEPADPAASGVVIDGETAITANVVRQLPAVPELVFLNCCHLARVDDRSNAPTDRHRLAASVARELMCLGVHAVVAAGWAVDDDAAVVFAETFYEELLGGALFGAAVQTGREMVHRRYPASTTWAAFQCYGDPGYRLFSAGAAAEAEHHMVSAGELVRRLRTITVLAGKIGLPDFEELSTRGRALVAELDGHRRRLATSGWDVPPVLYEFGLAYGELGAYAQAVECYRRAWDHADSNTAPVKLLEQLGNFEVRLAQQQVRAAVDAGAAADAAAQVGDLLEAAGAHLELALGLGETPERLALLGSFHKKAATLVGGDQRRRHVSEAARRYGEASELGSKHGRPKPYHALNWLQMHALAGAPVPEAEARAALAAVEPPSPGRAAAGPGDATGGTDRAEAKALDPEDFWQRVMLADLALTRYLLGEPADLHRLEGLYLDAFATRSSRRDRDTVVDHLRDVGELQRGSSLTDLARSLLPGAARGVAGGAGTVGLA